MKNKLKKTIEDVLVKNFDILKPGVQIDYPEQKFGDYATNVALIYGKQLKKNPKDLAQEIKEQLEKTDLPIEKIDIAGPGFLNFFLKRDFFAETIKQIEDQKKDFGQNELFKNEKIMVEYTTQNVFKQFHIGHLMSNSIGEAMSRIIEACSADLKRNNYQGDIGLHVAKAVWGMGQMQDQMPDESDTVEKKSKFLGDAYALGGQSYDSEETAKIEIDTINKKLYDRSDQYLNELYDKGRKWSLDSFEPLYLRLGTKFDFYFFESDALDIGKEKVEKGLKDGVFNESQGAVVFPGEKYGLHTRVFLTSEELPTYEAKDLGLAFLKAKHFDYDKAIVLTGSEQTQYFKVMHLALEMLDEDIASKNQHIEHGFLRLATGKMSSRTGDVVTAEDLLDRVKNILRDRIDDRSLSTTEREEVSEKVAIAALKYSILKQSPGKDIVFDFDKSLSFEGDSGPYLQYTCARANSVLQKNQSPEFDKASRPDQPYELERLLHRFPEIVQRSAEELSPQYLTHYLIEISREFNSFYGAEKIADGSEFTSYKLALTRSFKQVLSNGLRLLAISPLDRM